MVCICTGDQRASEQPSKVMAYDTLPGFSGDSITSSRSKGQEPFLTAEDHKTVACLRSEGKHLQSISGFGSAKCAPFPPGHNKLIVTRAMLYFRQG